MEPTLKYLYDEGFIGLWAYEAEDGVKGFFSSFASKHTMTNSDGVGFCTVDKIPGLTEESIKFMIDAEHYALYATMCADKEDAYNRFQKVAKLNTEGIKALQEIFIGTIMK